MRYLGFALLLALVLPHFLLGRLANVAVLVKEKPSGEEQRVVLVGVFLSFARHIPDPSEFVKASNVASREADAILTAFKKVKSSKQLLVEGQFPTLDKNTAVSAPYNFCSCMYSEWDPERCRLEAVQDMKERNLESSRANTVEVLSERAYGKSDASFIAMQKDEIFYYITGLFEAVCDPSLYSGNFVELCKSLESQNYTVGTVRSIFERIQDIYDSFLEKLKTLQNLVTSQKNKQRLMSSVEYVEGVKKRLDSFRNYLLDKGVKSSGEAFTELMRLCEQIVYEDGFFALADFNTQYISQIQDKYLEIKLFDQLLLDMILPEDAPATVIVTAGFLHTVGLKEMLIDEGYGLIYSTPLTCSFKGEDVQTVNEVIHQDEMLRCNTQTIEKVTMTQLRKALKLVTQNSESQLKDEL